MTQKKSVGVLNRGKNNKFINNSFSGFDVGIQDEGENTFARGNSFDDGAGRTEKWYQIWWGQVLIGLFVLLVGGFMLYKMGWN